MTFVSIVRPLLSTLLATTMALPWPGAHLLASELNPYQSATQPYQNANRSCVTIFSAQVNKAQAETMAATPGDLKLEPLWEFVKQLPGAGTHRIIALPTRSRAAYLSAIEIVHSHNANLSMQGIDIATKEMPIRNRWTFGTSYHLASVVACLGMSCSFASNSLSLIAENITLHGGSIVDLHNAGMTLTNGAVFGLTFVNFAALMRHLRLTRYISQRPDDIIKKVTGEFEKLSPDSHYITVVVYDLDYLDLDKEVDGRDLNLRDRLLAHGYKPTSEPTVE